MRSGTTSEESYRFRIVESSDRHQGSSFDSQCYATSLRAAASGSLQFAHSEISLADDDEIECSLKSAIPFGCAEGARYEDELAGDWTSIGSRRHWIRSASDDDDSRIDQSAFDRRRSFHLSPPASPCRERDDRHHCLTQITAQRGAIPPPRNLRPAPNLQ